MKTIKVGSDFSGVGAFNQALRRLGVEYHEIFACDMDKFARETFIHNYGEPEYYPKNVYEREIPSESLDIYVSSPPCQAFSLAGNRLGKDDKRGVLFFNSHEFIQKNQPRFFIFENVKGLLSDDNGNTFNEWLNLLGGKSVNGVPVLFPHEDAVDYHLYWKVLNAKDHGVPQNRERVFLIGIRDDKDNHFRFPVEEHLTKRLKDVLEEHIQDKYFLSDKKIQYLLRTEGDSINFSVLSSETRRGRVGKGVAQTLDTGCNQAVIIDRTNDFGENLRIYEKYSPALRSERSGLETIQNYKIRRLTPRECFRLMDFPDTFTWTVSDSQAYKQAGNSIVVNVLYKLLKNLPL